MKTLIVAMLASWLGIGLAAAGDRFACNMKALSAAERTRHQELSRSLIEAAQETKELPSGYGFRLPPARLVTAAEWVSLERRCCPFFTFEIEQARDEGPLWLRITGSEGVKDFIRIEFGLDESGGRPSR